MIENFNDLLSLISLLIILFGCVFGFIKINEAFKQDEAVDEYYRDLL